MVTVADLRQIIVDHMVADDGVHQSIVKTIDRFIDENPDGDFEAIRRLVVNHAEATDASHHRLVKAIDRYMKQK